MHVCAVRPRKDDAVIRVYDEGWQCDRDAQARSRLQRGVFSRKAQKKPRTCKRLPGRFNSVKKFRAFTASCLRRVSGSADHCEADRTSDRAGAARSERDARIASHPATPESGWPVCQASCRKAVFVVRRAGDDLSAVLSAAPPRQRLPVLMDARLPPGQSKRN